MRTSPRAHALPDTWRAESPAQDAQSTPPDRPSAENRSRPCIARTGEQVTKRPLLRKYQNGNDTYTLAAVFGGMTSADNVGGGRITTAVAMGGGGPPAYLRPGGEGAIGIPGNVADDPQHTQALTSEPFRQLQLRLIAGTLGDPEFVRPTRGYIWIGIPAPKRL